MLEDSSPSQTSPTESDPTSVNLSSLIWEKSVHGHRHVDELHFSYLPLKQSLAKTYGESLERDFWCAVIQAEGVRARAFFRYFPEIKTLTLDWIYIPKALRKKKLSIHLLRKMYEHFPEAEAVHLLLAHGNLRAFNEGAQRSWVDKVKTTPTTRQLGKLGFSELAFINWIQFPNDKIYYPEVVVRKPIINSDSANPEPSKA